MQSECACKTCTALRATQSVRTHHSLSSDLGLPCCQAVTEGLFFGFVFAVWAQYCKEGMWEVNAALAGEVFYYSILRTCNPCCAGV